MAIQIVTFYCVHSVKMYFHLILAHTCIAAVLVKQSHCYVVLAANLDDFKTIAKKIVPNELADQITIIAGDKESKKSDTSSENEQKLEGLRAKEKGKFSYYNFEELVEKVKERLLRDVLKKQIKGRLTKTSKGLKINNISTRNSFVEENYDENNENLDETAHESTTKQMSETMQHMAFEKMKKDGLKHNSQSKTKYKNHDKNHYYEDNVDKNAEYYEGNKNEKPTPETKRPQFVHKPNNDENGELPVTTEKDYQYGEEYEPYIPEEVNGDNHESKNPKIDMTFGKVEVLGQNDSYEDYVTPAKEENIFESDVEAKETRNSVVRLSNGKSNQPNVVQPRTERTQTTTETIEVREYVVDDEAMIEDSEELKAKTEDLWFDDKTTVIENMEDDFTLKEKTTKKKINTMMPKRDYSIMSSPNYFAKVPIVAEKYDFDEPIPEKDREPERNRKPLPTVPSIINGKVKTN